MISALSSNKTSSSNPGISRLKILYKSSAFELASNCLLPGFGAVERQVSLILKGHIEVM